MMATAISGMNNASTLRMTQSWVLGPSTDESMPKWSKNQ